MFLTHFEELGMIPIRKFKFRQLHSVPLAVKAGSKFYHGNTSNEELYGEILQRTSEKQGQILHGKIIKLPHLQTTFIWNHLLNMYSKCGNTEDGFNVFDEMPQRNVVSWSAMVAGLVQQGHYIEAVLLFREMHRIGTRPNHFTLVSTLNACSFMKTLELVKQIYAQVVRLGFELNVFLSNSYLTALIRLGELNEAMEFFEKTQGRDIVSWNAMIDGYVKLSPNGTWVFWRKLIGEGIKPDEFTFASILTGLGVCSSLEPGLQVHGQLVKLGHGDDKCVGNALVDMYLKCGALMDGMEAFKEMPERDVVSWTEMANGCLHLGHPGEALNLYEQMRLEGVGPNRFTLAMAINACASLVSLREGQRAHGLRVKLGEEADLYVDNALIDMYAKCGSTEDAGLVFRSISHKSVVTWTTMIMGYAQNGWTLEAIELFNRMRDQCVDPNHITFICVLYACSQGGLVDEGWSYFLSMRDDYGIEPGDDHYACMVDMLGRAGRIKEAKALIESMPCQPSVMVWQTLLGACRIHGDLETGKWAAKSALALDTQDPSTYVLLSNMFANVNSWDDVDKVRKIMDEREVQKKPGCSWIQVNGGTHSFLAHHGGCL
ncbi:pentatricopeptide repeat-containing protein At4g33170 [Amborella trichopoda]|uniref:pentatricopeptide repeat-containing protein At4g33170 n=1 Tax=Amborella trichopoda TaxID=13333 RepID=UPI0005D3FDCE|nr:pentatricopeptide repeat-containing protein At4g33170 [Amborella trichopoda]|eukprot:XP_011624782.1 pentatricopeptide repeat-containing protein At4g33170 [Amborella trichopoda]